MWLRYCQITADPRCFIFLWIMDATTYGKTIDAYISLLEEQITNSVYQLWKWNNDIRKNNIPVHEKTKSRLFSYFLSKVSLSYFLAGLLFWKQNLSCVIDTYKVFSECNDHLSESLIDLLTTHSFDAAGMAPLSMSI